MPDVTTPQATPATQPEPTTWFGVISESLKGQPFNNLLLVAIGAGVWFGLPFFMNRHDSMVKQSQDERQAIDTRAREERKASEERNEKTMERFWTTRNKDQERQTIAQEKTAEVVGKLAVTIDKIEARLPK